MPTNDKIREQEDMQMSHYKSLTPDEQADRERSLMDKARADTIRQILAELDWVTIIKDAEFKTGAYDEWAEAKAYQELRDRIEYLKKQHKVPL